MTDASGASAMVTRAEEAAARVLEENRARQAARIAERTARAEQSIKESYPSEKNAEALAGAVVNPGTLDDVISKPKPIIGKDPKAEAKLAELKRENESPKAVPSVSPPAATATPPTAAPAAAASVVPATQGPAKAPRQGDEIQSLARVPVAAPNWALSAQPSSASEMLQIAKTLFNSRFYSQFGSERGVFAVMAMGRELDMGYAEALEAFHIVKDRPFPKAKWLLARMQQHPDCEWCLITYADEKSATIKTKHKRFPDVLEFTYTIEMATAAGHTTGANKHNWEKNRRSMLRARAISGGHGDWYPGAAFGMHPEEVERDSD